LVGGEPDTADVPSVVNAPNCTPQFEPRPVVRANESKKTRLGTLSTEKLVYFTDAL